MSNSYLLRSYKIWLILGILMLVLVAAESVALHQVFTSKFPGANDFFVRWLGGRAYILYGTNPYDRDVAEEAQKAMFGRLTRPEDKDEAFFAYPLYTLFFFFPLSLLPYAWAQAIWMTVLQFMLLAVTILSLYLSGWRPPPRLYWFTVFWGIFFYNGARALILGQFSVLVALALLLGLWAIKQRHFGWAGIFLAVTTIKPQMIFLVLLFLMVWALTHKRWRLIISFGVSMLALVFSSMLLVPGWPLDFVKNAVAYSDYVAFGTPLENLLHYLFPASFAAPLTVILSALFFLVLLPGWGIALFDLRFTIYDLRLLVCGQPKIQNPKSKIEGAFTWAVMSSLIVGSLITFRSATTNQVILYLPLFFFFYRLSQTSLSKTSVNFISVLIEIGLALFMWTVFAVTIDGNWEHVMMHGLLPALMLVLYALDWRGLWRAAGALERSSGFSR